MEMIEKKYQFGGKSLMKNTKARKLGFQITEGFRVSNEIGFSERKEAFCVNLKGCKGFHVFLLFSKPRTATVMDGWEIFLLYPHISRLFYLF